NQPPENTDQIPIDRIPTVPLPPLRRSKKPLLLALLISCTCLVLFCMVGVSLYSAEALFKDNIQSPIPHVLAHVNTATTTPPTLTSAVITPTPTLPILVPVNISTITPPTPTSVEITPT